MITKNLFRLSIATVVGLTLGVSPVGATIISPLGGSFEDPVATVESGGGWLGFTVPTGWTASSTANFQIIHRNTPYYGAPVDGNQLYGLEADGYGELTQYSGIQQDLGTMTAGEKYTFNATLISNAEYPVRASYYRISFYNVTDDVELAAITQEDFDPSALGGGQTLAAFFSYTATAADNGDVLRLIMNPSTTEGTVLESGWMANRTGVDAVSVTVTPVPEPSTIALLVGAMFGLLAYAWRRRK